MTPVRGANRTTGAERDDLQRHNFDFYEENKAPQIQEKGRKRVFMPRILRKTISELW